MCQVFTARRLKKFSLKYNMAFTVKMVTFCKDKNCPTSQDLLAFQTGSISKKLSKKIETHLPECEFCASEIEFYAHYPQSEEKVANVEIPIPLYELAEALLSNQHKDVSALNKLLSDNENVKI